MACYINWFKGAQVGNLWDVAVCLVQTKNQFDYA